MRQSTLFTKTRKNAPSEEVAKNAQLLIRAGFIHKEMAGVYDYLPLGLRVLKKIEGIIREEMNAIGGQEMLLTTLQDSMVWKKSGRWDDANVDNWFKTELKSGAQVGVANTHEEPLAQLLAHFVDSYKELPIYVYQFQTKFRNELRAKSGIMRAREFLMKDLYSFSKTEEEMRVFYEACAAAYLRIFARVGVGAYTYRTIAPGGSFTTGLTDEFQVTTNAGEDVIYIDEMKRLAINKEVYTDENISRLGMEKSRLVEKKSIEVANIFPLGTKYAEAVGLYYKNEKGEKYPVVMGSYGIGLGRLLGTVVEVLSDEKGIVWPKSIAPFIVHVVVLAGQEGKGVRTEAEKLVMVLEKEGIEVLYDDREVSAGEKFADSDLIGIPYRVVVSEKTIAQNSFELKERSTGAVRLVTEAELLELAR